MRMKLGFSAVIRNRAAIVFATVLLGAGLPVKAQSIFTSNTATGRPAQPVEAPIKPEGTATTATEIVDGKNQNAMLVSNGDALLQAATARYQSIIDQGGFPKVSGNNLKKGDKGAGVAALNRRLYIEGYLRVEGTQGQFADLFTTATQDALARFQRNHGLAVTGKTDAATVAELNVPAEKRLATINANLPRLAQYEQGLGDRYLVVNIPAQQLEAVTGGRVFERHNVIVGRPARPTPVVMTPLATVKFNPYWNAPISIVEKDIIPKLDSKFTYLVEHDIKILRGGQNGEVVDPHTIDFKTVNLEDLLFRQEPGPENAMATAKIEFNSPFGIYLHDTPEKQMFAYNNRFFSSGCIRVQNMPQLVNWVLNGQDGYDPGRISDMAQSLERLDVPLQAPPQLRVAYLTAWPAANGTVAFRNDIYNLDGTGFIVGQPMPVGQMSPDGKRFVLKPLPRALSVDEAEAEGSGFFGAKASKPGNKSPTPFGLSNKTASALGNQPTLSNAGNSGGAPGAKSKGLFDWEAYRKQQAMQAKAGAVKATTATTTKKVVKKALKKINCNSAADGSKPECNPPGVTPKAAGDTAKKP
jgi:murein L,D-transpeptidase YcbB/YkuD